MDDAAATAPAGDAMTAGGESLADPASAPLTVGAVGALWSRLPAGADPDEVRDWFAFETIVELPMPALSFAEAEAAAADYRRAARADNTRRAYRAAVARFTDWCHEHRQTALPAAPETVAAFLAAEAGRGLAVNTLRLRHAALRYLHLLAGYPPPTASPLVSATFAGIRRAHRRPLRKKTALVLEPLRMAIKTIPDTLPGLARPRPNPGRLCRGVAPVGIGAARYRVIDPPRRWHRALSAMAQERPGGPRHHCVAARRTDRSLSRSPPSKPGSPPPKSATARCSGDCGICRRRECPRG